MKTYILILSLFISGLTTAQVGIGTTTPDPSALLEIKSTDKGLLIPKMDTATIGLISSPANSLMVYNTDLNCVQVNSGTETAPRWECIIENNRALGALSKRSLACNNDLTIHSTDVITNSYVVVYPKEGNAFSDACSTTAVNGDVVKCLGNFASPGVNFEVPTGSNGPTLVSPGNAATNQEPYLSFNSTNNNSLFLSNPDGNEGDAFNLFIYFRIDAATGQNGAILGVGKNGAAANAAFGSNVETTWQIGRGINSPGAGLATGDQFVFRYNGTDKVIDIPIMPWTDFAGSDFRFLAIKYAGGNNGSIKIYVDGILKADTTITTNSDTAGLAQGMYRFGVNRDYNRYVNGDLAELSIGKPSLTPKQFIVTQAYYLCKYGLDTSVFTEEGPYGIVEQVYNGQSQFEYQVFRDPIEKTLGDGKTATSDLFVYDSFNNTYYLETDVPTPGLGVKTDFVTSAISGENIPAYPSTPGTYKLGIVNGILDWIAD